jgi:hypothetical protein
VRNLATVFARAWTSSGEWRLGDLYDDVLGVCREWRDVCGQEWNGGHEDVRPAAGRPSVGAQLGVGPHVAAGT